MKSEVAKKRAKMRAADPPLSSPGQSLKFHLVNLAFLVSGIALTLVLLGLTPRLRHVVFEGTTPATLHAASGAAQDPAAVGPWGWLEITPFALPEPDSFLADSAEPLAAARWVFENYTPDGLSALFASLPANADLKARLLDRTGWQILQDGVVLHPSRELLERLDRPTRQRLYPLLGESRHNFSHYHSFRFPGRGFRQWFRRSGLPEEILDLIEDLTYTNRYGALCLVDIALLQHRLTQPEFHQFLRSLYSEPAVLASLRIHPKSDLPTMAAYWGRGGREEEVLPLLQAVAEVPGGGSLSIGHLLPPFARNRLYTYRSDTNNVVNEQDCFWTAVNFFRRNPDPRLKAGLSPHQILLEEYTEIREAPRLGDVLVFMQRGSAIHACVQVAGDVVFTKNGANFRQPWILMRLPDLITRYSSDQPIALLTLRPKNPALGP
ncbi:MAG: hypothetical protein RJA22_2878 [Verrucomicrobiota bacterium]